MALLHRANLRPTKLELLAAWLPHRRWVHGQLDAALERVASYRFDDPAGAVGMETILVSFGRAAAHHVPLTYRGDPLPGGEDWLIGTTEHSVLGRRWVYDACGDPVYAAALARAVFGGTGQAEEFMEVDGRLERREPTMKIASSGPAGADVPPVGAVRRVVDDGAVTVIVTDSVEFGVVRRPDGHDRHAGSLLTGAWSTQSTPVTLAYGSPRAG
jgi:hypothetical protein